MGEMHTVVRMHIPTQHTGNGKHRTLSTTTNHHITQVDTTHTNEQPASTATTHNGIPMEPRTHQVVVLRKQKWQRRERNRKMVISYRYHDSCIACHQYAILLEPTNGSACLLGTYGSMDENQRRNSQDPHRTIYERKHRRRTCGKPTTNGSTTSLGRRIDIPWRATEVISGERREARGQRSKNTPHGYLVHCDTILGDTPTVLWFCTTHAHGRIIRLRLGMEWHTMVAHTHAPDQQRYGCAD